MRNRINCEPRFEYDGSIYKGSYLDYSDEVTKEYFYTLVKVNEDDFDRYIKRYDEDLLISIVDYVFDEVNINWYDINNHHDIIKFKSKTTDSITEIPMILFKIGISGPACASVYYVNNRIIERYNL